MPKYANEIETFRHRGYDDAENSKVVMLFGEGQEPLDSKGVVLNKIWDHDVTSVTTVVDHV